MKRRSWYHMLLAATLVLAGCLMVRAGLFSLWDTAEAMTRGNSPAAQQIRLQSYPEPEPPPSRPEPELPGPGQPEEPEQPEPRRESRIGRAPTPVPAGRITGTVIDQTTGAPRGGVPVQIGDVVVYSDTNGNYERVHLFPGNYTVALVLNGEQGMPLQDPMVVTVESDQNVVQHLFFSSPLVATATPPPLAPAAPTPTAVVPPQGAPPAEVPGSLPVTGQEPRPQAPAPAPAEFPRMLPHTAQPTEGGMPWAWMGVGVMLLVSGVGVWYVGGHTKRDQ